MAGASKLASGGILTPKRKKFVREYVKNGGNATEAYKAAYNSSKMALPSIHEEARRSLRIPSVNSEIQRLLSDNGIEITDILGIHSRNMHQQDHLPTSQRAAESLAEMIGLKQQAKLPTINVAFVINDTTPRDTSPNDGST